MKLLHLLVKKFAEAKKLYLFELFCNVVHVQVTNTEANKMQVENSSSDFTFCYGLYLALCPSFYSTFDFY